MGANEVKLALEKAADADTAKTNAWFFKTKKGEYGHGDKFIGVKVPDQRSVAKKFRDLSQAELTQLFKSPVHEHRLTACFITVLKYQALEELDQKTELVKFYLHQLEAGRINNWDLVDSSAPQILGRHYSDKSRRKLYDLVQSDSIWSQRAAMMATFAFIRQDDFADTFALAETLLSSNHDLIHKAAGWMLREVGNRDREAAEIFLRKHYKYMPRTMLRYAIEKFPSSLREQYLSGRI